MDTQVGSRALLQQAARIGRLERGKLSIIRETPAGPFYNHQCRENGKNVTRYVPREQVEAVQAAIDGYADFQNLIEQYVDQVVAETRAEIAAHSKKKKRAPSSSRSPRTRKSAG
jgi:hypothetical protein